MFPKPFLLLNPVLDTLIFSSNPVLGRKTLLNHTLINQIACIGGAKTKVFMTPTITIRVVKYGNVKVSHTVTASSGYNSLFYH